MKKLCAVLLALPTALCLTLGASADLISPAGQAAYMATRPLTWAVVAVVAVTAVLIRRSGKKK